MLVLWSGAARAQDCPTAQTARTGFVVERGDRQKTEVFHRDEGHVRAITRFNGAAVLEATQHEGLFDLERLDRGRRTKLETKTDLKKLFPLRVGKTVSASFTTERDGQQGQLAVEVTIKAREDSYIGACKYSVMKFDWNESRGSGPPRLLYTGYYSPDLKLILAKEYRDRDMTQTIKYDRIYPIKP